MDAAGCTLPCCTSHRQQFFAYTSGIQLTKTSTDWAYIYAYIFVKRDVVSKLQQLTYEYLHNLYLNTSRHEIFLLDCTYVLFCTYQALERWTWYWTDKEHIHCVQYVGSERLGTKPDLPPPTPLPGHKETSFSGNFYKYLYNVMYGFIVSFILIAKQSLCWKKMIIYILLYVLTVTWRKCTAVHRRRLITGSPNGWGYLGHPFPPRHLHEMRTWTRSPSISPPSTPPHNPFTVGS